LTTETTYQVTDPVEFLSQPWAFPRGSLAFWSRGQAGGVLLLAGVHYAPNKPGMVAFTIPGLAAGDVIVVVSF
jgi:hypothetical protein